MCANIGVLEAITVQEPVRKIDVMKDAFNGTVDYNVCMNATIGPYECLEFIPPCAWESSSSWILSNLQIEGGPDSGFGMGGWIPNAQALKKTNLEYIHISIGMFSDYFGMPHTKSNLKPRNLFLDIENERAAVPEDGDVRISVAYSEDLARFIVRLVDDDSKWPKRGLLSGSDTSVNELIASWKLNVVHDTLENIQKRGATVFHCPEGISEDKWKPKLAKFYEMFITGAFVLPNDERRLDRRYPEISVSSGKEILARA
ncbi:hypothetical protein FOXYSP1_00021 [Fusarium oxysporum f. sp. phaseoli]